MPPCGKSVSPVPSGSRNRGNFRNRFSVSPTLSGEPEPIGGTREPVNTGLFTVLFYGRFPLELARGNRFRRSHMMVPPHRCPSCGALVPGGHCPACARRREAARPSAAARGYLSLRWRQLRLVQLARQPLCSQCGKVAEHVDHVTPHRGPLDELFWRESNLDSLCHRCHSSKTARFDSNFLSHHRVER